MVISLELLDSLHGLSLPLAASTVGVPATAFKKACRRLGVPDGTTAEGRAEQAVRMSLVREGR